MFYCKLILDDKREYRCNYIYIEEVDNSDEELINLFEITPDIPLIDYEGDIVVQCILEKHSNCISEIKLKNLKLTLHSKFNATIICMIEYTNEDNEYDYYEYDQNLIYLFYNWDNMKPQFMEHLKATYLYTFATLLYSGVPNNCKFNSYVEINGNEILNEYHFFNKLAEFLLGEKAYLAGSVAGLYDTLRTNKDYLEKNTPTILIKNYNELDRVLNIQSSNSIKENHVFKQGYLYKEGYLQDIISLLREYHFTVIID